MICLPKKRSALKKLLEEGTKLPLAIENYPSRGQTAVQELYQTCLEKKLFLKKSSKRNHRECQVKIDDGTLAEREFWAFRLASALKLNVPEMVLFDPMTTVQVWIDLPDAHSYATHQGRMELIPSNVFDCALFDWLTGQIDRHDANYLYNFVSREIVLVDSAHAFLRHEGSLPDYLRLFEVSCPFELMKVQKSKILKILIDLTRPDLKKLVPLRNLDESEALFNRQQQLKKVKTIQGIIDLYRRGK